MLRGTLGELCKAEAGRAPLCAMNSAEALASAAAPSAARGGSAACERRLQEGPRLIPAEQILRHEKIQGLRERSLPSSKARRGFWRGNKIKMKLFAHILDKRSGSVRVLEDGRAKQHPDPQLTVPLLRAASHHPATGTGISPWEHVKKKVLRLTGLYINFPAWIWVHCLTFAFPNL